LDFSIYNWSLKLSPFKHECTHIGDELTIRRRDAGFPITRINVSFNYAELVFTLNDPDSQVRLNHGFRFGTIFNYKFKGGWYDWYDLLETEANLDYVEKSTFPFEIYLQYQFQSNPFSRGFQIIASFEYRLRERYKYPFSYSGSLGEYMENNPHILDARSRSISDCYNVYLGIRYNNPNNLNYFSKIGVGLRYYKGINPHGQFRAMPTYHQIGLVLVIE